MKECPLTLIADRFKCSNMGQENCLFMLNESLENGSILHLQEFMEKASDRYLMMWAKSRRKGRIRESCLKYDYIRDMAKEILKSKQQNKLNQV